MWKILAIDDDPTSCRLYKLVLADHATCDTVETPKAAMELFCAALRFNNPYDFILLDISLPEMNGVELLKRFRDIEEKNGVPLGKGVPVIMVTNHSEPFMQSFREGADEYLLKPFSADDLIGKIRRSLNGKTEDLQYSCG